MSTDMLNATLDSSVIREVLGDMEYFHFSDTYYELQNNKWFAFYEELFIDIAIVAEKLRESFYNMTGRLPAFSDGKHSGLDLAAMLLNYSGLDYCVAFGYLCNTDAAQHEQEVMDTLAAVSKKDQREVIIRAFEFMVEFQKLKTTYKLLIELLQTLEEYNLDEMGGIA